MLCFNVSKTVKMATSQFPLCKTLNPSSPFLPSTSLTPFSNPLLQTLTPKSHQTRKPLSIISGLPNASVLPIFRQISQFPFANSRPDIRTCAGRSKKKGGGPSPGRIEGNAEFRRKLRNNVRRKSQKPAESHFYRRKNSNSNYADNFSEDELQQIGLGYDRMVRFMEKDDPNLRHPHDWYKYGEFGPYSWRGVVIGEPIRGRFTDERVTMIREVKDHEEWEKIEQSEMASDFSEGLQRMDRSKGFRHFWVFVRHPRWRISELPWQQWTLIAEVVLEAGKEERLDKWSLMGRLGNKSRKNITQCAAWMRPDIIYVKKPVYQCRFEPQAEFFQALMPFLDPKTEQDVLFELQDDEGNVEWVTYFGGLCKILRVNPKAFVDDVANAYEKLSDEKKSKCLEFLLTNHPVPLLHPYTKEWKAKLEEEELGCDAPDDDNENQRSDENVVMEWIETDDDNEDDDYEDEAEDVVMETNEEAEDEEDGGEHQNEEEDEDYWDERFRKAISSPEELEKLLKRSEEARDEFYEKQKGWNVGSRKAMEDDGDETELRGKRAKVKPEEWERIGYGPWRKKIKKSQIPPELFLRSTVRPFTYRNLVKEIVLTRHAILEGEIGV